MDLSSRIGSRTALSSRSPPFRVRFRIYLHSVVRVYRTLSLIHLVWPSTHSYERYLRDLHHLGFNGTDDIYDE